MKSICAAMFSVAFLLPLSSAEVIGLNIEDADAQISLGLNGDVVFRRVGEGQLDIEGTAQVVGNLALNGIFIDEMIRQAVAPVQKMLDRVAAHACNRPEVISYSSVVDCEVGECNEGYEPLGDSCDAIDKCARGNVTVCGTGGTCSKLVLDSDEGAHGVNTFECACADGYETTGTGVPCSEINECADIECMHGGICMDGIAKFTCRYCDDGYEGGDNKVCTDVNSCSLDIDGCGGDPNAECSEDNEDDLTFEAANWRSCTCAPGFRGDETLLDSHRFRGCTDINECNDVDCGPGGTCSHEEGETEEGKYTCTCAEGYEGGGDNTPCVDTNECLGVDCGDGGRCEHKKGAANDDYTCVCTEPGWAGGGVQAPCVDLSCSSIPNAAGDTLAGGCECAPGFSGTISAITDFPFYESSCEACSVEHVTSYSSGCTPAACDHGYFVEDDACVGYGGSCENGDLITQSARTIDNHCGSCDEEYVLRGFQCVEKVPPPPPSYHATVPFNPGNVAGGCSYGNHHNFKWENLGSMTWKACVEQASKRGAMMTPGAYSVADGWYGHRKNGNAMWGVWASYRQKSITDQTNCILGIDQRSSTTTSERTEPLSDNVDYDGDNWSYQDYGMKYFDECLLYASNAGAVIITPYTIGKSGDDYWSHSVHMCCTYEWIVSSGTSFTYASIGGYQRTGQHKCMVGYMNGPEGSGGGGGGSTCQESSNDGYISVSELNTCLQKVGASFYEVQYIEVAYGHTDYLDNICDAFGQGSYNAPYGGDACGGAANMYPSHCNQGWKGGSCYNGCGNTNYVGFTCTG